MLRTYNAFSIIADTGVATLARLHRSVRLAIMFLAGAFMLTACEREWSTDYDEPLSSAATANWRVSSVQVSVPDTLTVSDVNRFFVEADIVWHGDPAGDRRAQVKAITTAGVQEAARGLNGSRPVVLDVTVLHFHGVSPITVARAPGAVHNMKFAAQVRDARTGATLTEPTLILAEMPALVGEAAYYAAQFGPTQKERVTAHIAATFSGWLGTGPDNRGSFISVGK
ncbi:DUF6778 family protein [Sedimentitalea todarodis]|uniref:DUF3313 domain-containing protein n=1 Tax=Sedimentitalea todarodis TaxID=1631240 RepID=A0ABU3VCG7_9RHOB|nr:DUF6778 family protein [Sedimentitalea todarodis]MDU9003870.1 hypothetical protein [Sedimentitalea todarodis]